MSSQTSISLGAGLALFCLTMITSIAESDAASMYRGAYDYDENFIKADLTSRESIVEMRFTDEVNAYIRTYLVNGRSISERIVNRMMLYFPIIEQKLSEHNLPEELKFLAIIESGLDPKARSHIGAVGLWQFMAPTAREYGMRMYHSVDERMDPYRSTDAALTYLKRLFERFGDWELALAAYNVGPNRLMRLMARTNSTDYWELQKHLPRETANYIPKFIAASYLFSDFNQHGFIPERSHPDYHFTSRVELINHKLYLQDIADLLHVDFKSLKKINPMYKSNYIPKSDNGYNLIIPNRSMPYFNALRDTLDNCTYIRLSSLKGSSYIKSAVSTPVQNIYVETKYVVGDDDDLNSVSGLFNLNKLQLKYWNNLHDDEVENGMPIYIPVPMEEGKEFMKDYNDGQEINALDPRKLADIQLASLQRNIYQEARMHTLVARQRYHLERLRERQSMTLRQGIPLTMIQGNKPSRAAVDLVKSDATPGKRVPLSL